MFWKKSADAVRKASHEPSPTSHAVQMQVREELIGAQAREIEELKRINYALDRTAARYKRERDELQAKINRMTGGLIPGGPKAKAKRDAAANGVAAH